MQPTYLPWMGYFDLMDKSDVFVFLDDVQFEKQSWQQRNKIKTPNGEMLLTIPVKQKLNQKIVDVEIDIKEKWEIKHNKSIRYNYNKAQFFDKYYSFFEEIYSEKWYRLAEFNINIIKWIMHQLKIETKLLRSSELNISGKKTSLIIDICKRLNADTYLSPMGAKLYIEKELFNKAGIKLEYQQFEHPSYKQLYGKFIPYLSVIDLLFNEGANSLTIIRSGEKIEFKNDD